MAVLLVLATLLAYQPAWHAEFIWDDDQYVTNNLTLHSLDGLRQIWFNLTATPQYYPLVHTSFWLEYHLWGLNPLGYHVVNVLLHALAAILLWRVLVRLQVPGAWLAAGIFVLHPVGVESVAWVTERKNVLAGVFYFAAALAYLRWMGQGADEQKRGSLRWYFFAFALFIAALLSKTVACSLPAAMLLMIWWKRGRVVGRDVWPLLPFFAAGLALGSVTSWLERTHVGAQGQDWAFSFPERCLIAGRALWFYAGKLFWPADLTFIYPRWQLDAGVWWQWMYPVGALAAVTALWCLRGRMGRGPLVAALFFGGTLVPALGFTNVYPMRYSFVADHFQYLACIGLLVLVAVGIAMAFGFLGKRNLWLKPVLYGGLLVTLGVLTWRQCHIYADQETLWRDTLAKNSACWMAHNNLGNVLLQKGQVNEAIAQFKNAIEIKPDYAEPYNNLGHALFHKDQMDEAIVLLQQALAIRPDYAEAHNNLGGVFLKKGQVNEAIIQFQKALAIQPDDVEAHNNLGTALVQKGQMDEAIIQFQKVLAIQPDHADARYNLGNAFVREGKVDEAIIQFQKALAIQPDYVEACNNLGTALVQKGRVDEAIVQFQRAMAIQPDNVEAHYNLGNALFRKGQVDEAIAQYQRALAIQPDDVEARNNLGTALFERGRVDEAIIQFQKALAMQPGLVAAKSGLANIAWVLATSPVSAVRNGTKAVELSQQTDRLSGGTNSVMAATLAAAYAEAGRFPEAITTIQRALQLASGQNNPALVAALEAQLKLYQAGSPFHQTGTSN